MDMNLGEFWPVSELFLLLNCAWARILSLPRDSWMFSLGLEKFQVIWIWVLESLLFWGSTFSSSNTSNGSFIIILFCFSTSGSFDYIYIRLKL